MRWTSIPSQPDAEPSVPLESNDSEGYLPSTPHSLMPDISPHDGIQVPIPSESEEDELTMEDYWVIQEKQAIRVHKQPRKQLFQPWEDQECPLNILTVLGDRTTMRRPLNETLIIQEKDRWDEKDKEPTTHGEEWTGITVFELIPEEEIPEVEEIHHVEPNQYWECALTLTQQELIQTMDSTCDVAVLLASAATSKGRSQTKGPNPRTSTRV